MADDVADLGEEAELRIVVGGHPGHEEELHARPSLQIERSEDLETDTHHEDGSRERNEGTDGSDLIEEAVLLRRLIDPQRHADRQRQEQRGDAESERAPDPLEDLVPHLDGTGVEGVAPVEPELDAAEGNEACHGPQTEDGGALPLAIEPRQQGGAHDEHGERAEQG